MISSIAAVLRSIIFAPWYVLRIFRGRAPLKSTPSTRAKARSQGQKSSGLAQSQSQAQSHSQQQRKTKPNKARMETAAAPATTEEKSKLHEQATAKGELSYSYWAGKGGGGVPLPEPRKLTDQEKEELERQAKASGASAWNAAGTFEERNATSWAKSRLTELVRGLELPGGDVRISDVNSCEGEANIFLVRGKKRCGFEFELQLAWKAKPRPEAIDITGTCKVVNFSSDDPDDLDVLPEVGHRQPDRAADEASALGRVKAVLKPLLAKLLEQLLAELKQK